MTNIPDPGWKGQPDPAEREETPCEICDGKGYLEGQTYGFAAIPDDWESVQRCDACERYPSDAAAAFAYAEIIELARRADGVASPVISVAFFEATDDTGSSLGDWAVTDTFWSAP
jgi:hypothetical protein